MILGTEGGGGGSGSGGDGGGGGLGGSGGGGGPGGKGGGPGFGETGGGGGGLTDQKKPMLELRGHGNGIEKSIVCPSVSIMLPSALAVLNVQLDGSRRLTSLAE